MFDQTKLEQVRAANDIVQVVSAFVPLKRSGARWLGLCPFHNEKSPSFSVNAELQIFKCFGCQVGGDVFKFLMLREGLSFPEAVRALAERAGIEMPDGQGERIRNGPGKADLYATNEWAARQFHQWLLHWPSCQHARDYLHRRGVTAESIAKFRLGAVPDSWDSLLTAVRQSASPPGVNIETLVTLGLLVTREGRLGDGASPAANTVHTADPAQPTGSATPGYYDRFRNRLMFPIVDTMNRVVGFGGRTLGGDSAKYINSPESPVFAKGLGVFGLNHAAAAIRASGRAVVVEGYMDCLLPQQAGVAEVVAALGTALTNEQSQLLRRYADKLVLVFDSDAAGERAADRALQLLLTEPVSVFVAQVPAGKDPADYVLAHGGEPFRRLLDAAVPALNFKLDLVRRRLGAADSIEGRRRAAEEMLSALAVSARFDTVDPIRRGLLLSDLARLTGIDASDLRTRLAEIRQQQIRQERLRVGLARPPRRETALQAAPAAAVAVSAVPEPSLTTNADFESSASATPQKAPPASANTAIPSQSAVAPAGLSRSTAERWLLALLLRQPDFYATVREEMSAESFRDPVAAGVAQCLLRELADTLDAERPFDPARWMGRVLTEPAGSAMLGVIDELHQLGQTVRQPGQALTDVLAVIAQDERNRLVAEQLPRIQQRLAAGDTPISEDEEYLRLAQRVQTRGRDNRRRPRIGP